MSFFSNFPKLFYAFNLKTESPKAVTNIFSRFKVRSQVLNNAYSFYKYQLADGDTPDIVAYKQYGDPSYHWIVCYVNDIMDAQFEFPLTQPALERKMLKQYDLTSIGEAYSTIHHYELEVEDTLAIVNGATTVTTNNYVITLDQYNYTTNTLSTVAANTSTTQVYHFHANNADPSSANTATLTQKSTYKQVMVYDHEYRLNEEKREIKLLKPQYIQPLVFELETILNG